MAKKKGWVITCPKCKAQLRTEIKRETITEAIPAEVNEWLEVEIDTQTTLAKKKKEGV